MLLVRTHLAYSPIHGIGVFASEDIPAGEKVWEFREGIDVMLPPDIFTSPLPASAHEYFMMYSYRSKHMPGKGFVLECDNSRFMNHSETPNLDHRQAYVVARRAIAKGEELTCNYSEFCEEFELLAA